MFHLEPEFFIPFLVFAIPIIAIIGGITAGIVRTMGQQRLAELAARERLAAIEKGIDPSKLPPPPGYGSEWGGDWSAPRDPNRRAQSLMIGGLVTLAVGIGLSKAQERIGRGPRPDPAAAVSAWDPPRHTASRGLSRRP